MASDGDACFKLFGGWEGDDTALLLGQVVLGEVAEAGVLRLGQVLVIVELKALA